MNSAQVSALENARATEAARPRVFVVQETTHNITVALDYGELKFLLPMNENVMLNPQPVVRRLRRELRDYKPTDYILPLGDPVAIGVAVAVASSLTNGMVSILKFDRQTRRYFPVRLDIFDRLPPTREETLS
jgi:hypothetical protein